MLTQYTTTTGMNMKIIAVSNAKGGVGKTTTALNVGSALAASGKKVLLVDIDKGDLTNGLNIELQDGDATIYEVLTDGVPLANAIRHVTMERTGTAYDVVPADSAMVNLTSALSTVGSSQYLLAAALEPVDVDYDYVLIDCPPAIDVATVNALTAADEVLIPALPHFYSMDALTRLVDTVDDVKANLNPRLQIVGILLTNYVGRSKHHQAVRTDVEQMFPGLLFDTAISNNVAVSESSYEGVDLFEYVATTPSRRYSKTVTQYTTVVSELLEREG